MYLILLESYGNKALLFFELLKHLLSRKKVNSTLKLHLRR